MKPKFPTVITAHVRETFNSCHAKLKWSEIVGLQPNETNVHQNAGAAYAAALEAFRLTYWTPGHVEDEKARYDAAVAAGFKALIVKFGPEDPPPEEKKQFDRVVAAYVEYLFNYPPGREHAPPSIGPNGRPRVEFSFAFEIADVLHPETGDPLLYTGRLDLLADYTGALFVLDDKTTSGIGPHWRRQWDLRSQITGYVVGGQTLDYTIVGSIIRGMAILKTECKTAEAITHRPAWMVERWKTRLVWDVRRMIQCWKDDYWPNTGEESGACYQYGICPYHVLCTAQAPEHYAPVYFTEGRWDPTRREVVKENGHDNPALSLDSSGSGTGDLVSGQPTSGTARDSDSSSPAGNS